MRHDARRIISVIDVPLWDKAHWHAAVYGGFADPPGGQQGPPILALGFQDQDAGIAIFKEWQSRRKETGETDFARVTIVTGIEKLSPHAYTMLIGAEVSTEVAKASPGGVIMVSRRLEMNPSSPRNLDAFLAAYRREGRYIFAPALFTDVSHPPRLLTQYGIMQTKLIIKAAWEIGEHDLDILGLSLENDPMIPEGVRDPPVHAALKRIREHSGLR